MIGAGALVTRNVLSVAGRTPPDHEIEPIEDGCMMGIKFLIWQRRIRRSRHAGEQVDSRKTAYVGAFDRALKIRGLPGASRRRSCQRHDLRLTMLQWASAATRWSRSR